MEYVYAGLLLHHAKKELSEDGLKKVLEASGIQVDDVRVKALVASLKEVNIEETIKAASTAAVGAAPSVAPSAGAPAAEKKESKKEEKPEAATEEEVSTGLGALFG